MNKYYSSQVVWKRIDENQAVRYLCFYDLISKKYAVQNAEFFYVPVSKERLFEADMNALELFIDIDPAERCDWFEELLDAIKNHELDFS
ncbi:MULTISPECIES: hypothetical protein [Pseudomonas syringae group genomosp. 2]|uniref:hypothetical protein n=1 Tax=Pseudomonas syringae group genomosp. 2 TaxID=251698 RepID=UPI0006D5E431|nr:MULTISPECIES: hypothetical protein [Pseudomonas syringae group genomosp. 2]